MAIVEYEEFKGNKMIVLKNDENDRFPFKFGLGKGKKIVENFEAIKTWVEKMEGQKKAEKENQAPAE
ncbi:hypothetical protein KJ633_03030 [bacterium]|nr:hypothetical protein [Candidatus Omnitrophota bacterium]MBA3065641.1 hypothetical protein [bacterium]MBU3955409.1 hypothetical protein [bacterium]